MQVRWFIVGLLLAPLALSACEEKQVAAPGEKGEAGPPGPPVLPARLGPAEPSSASSTANVVRPARLRARRTSESSAPTPSTPAAPSSSRRTIGRHFGRSGRGSPSRSWSPASRNNRPPAGHLSLALSPRPRTCRGAVVFSATTVPSLRVVRPFQGGSECEPSSLL